MTSVKQQKADRRSQRTYHLVRSAFAELLLEKPYDTGAFLTLLEWWVEASLPPRLPTLQEHGQNKKSCDRLDEGQYKQEPRSRELTLSINSCWVKRLSCGWGRSRLNPGVVLRLVLHPFPTIPPLIIKGNPSLLRTKAE